MLLLNTLGILLSTFFNVWGRKGFRTAPIPNKQAGLSSSVAQNSGTSKYRKCSGKSASIYCCIRFHPSQCVSPMDRRLIQILLIIGGVEQNPGPGTNSPEGKDKLSPKRSVAKDAPKCSPNTKRKERLPVTKSTTKKEYKLSRKIADGINYLLNGQESSINPTDDQPYSPEDLSRMSYTYDYDDEEIEQYGTEPVPITQMPIQNIPSNTNAQQYPDVSSILRENEQLKAMVANFEQKLASHQLLPPKATPHVSYLQCSYPREFSLYYLIHYFSIKISKDKQAQPIDFTTFPPLSNISALDMLGTVLRSASHIFQPAVVINSQNGGFPNRAGCTFSLTHPISCLGLLQNPAQAIYNAAFETHDSDYIQFVKNRDCPFIVALRHSELTAPPNTNKDANCLTRYPDDPVTAYGVKTRRICALLCYMDDRWSALVKIRDIIYEIYPGTDTQFTYSLTKDTPDRVKQLLKNTIAVIFGPPRDSFIPHQLLRKSRSVSRASARSSRSRKPSKLPPRRNTQTTTQNRINKEVKNTTSRTTQRFVHPDIKVAL